jgi:hypothetical protein
MQHLKLQSLRAGEDADREPRIEQLCPEFPLPDLAIKLVVEQPSRGDRHSRVHVEHENQPLQSGLSRGVELKFRIRHIGPVPHWRAVPQADQPDIDIAAAHHFLAVPGRFVVTRTEVRS